MKRRSQFTRNQGFALVSVIVFGAFAIAMMMALFPLVVNVMQSETNGRSMNELRAAAEVGIDYGISQLNDFALTPPCPIDQPGSRIVPPAYLDGFTNGTVKIQIRKLSPTEWNTLRTYSTIYSSSLDVENGPNGSRATQYLTPVQTSMTVDYWRILESTATRGIFSKSVRVYLEPRFDAPPGGTLQSSGSPSSYFKNAFFGNSQISLAPTSGSLQIASPSQVPGNGKYVLSVQSNESASLSSNVKLSGDLVVSNAKSGAPAEVVTVSNTAAPPTIEGRLLANGGISSSLSGDANNQYPNYNNLTVQARADLITGSEPRSGVNLTDPVDTTSTNAALAQAPAQTNSNAATLPDLTNGASLSGAYSTTSMTVGNGLGSAQVSAPTQIYIQDGTSTRSAADITASSLTNTTGSPQSLQIWYSGNRPIKLNLDANFTGVIYAPNAPITVTGNNQGSTFNGAVVGDKVVLNNAGQMNINTDLQIGTKTLQATGLAFWSTDGISPILQGYKAVTWQEIPGVVVP